MRVASDVVIAAVNIKRGSAFDAQRLIVSSAAAVNAARLFFRRVNQSDFRVGAADNNGVTRADV